MWRKKNPHTLLVGMQTSATTLEKKFGGFLQLFKVEQGQSRWGADGGGR
jgi:hypothetical protein